MRISRNRSMVAGPGEGIQFETVAGGGTMKEINLNFGSPTRQEGILSMTAAKPLLEDLSADKTFQEEDANPLNKSALLVRRANDHSPLTLDRSRFERKPALN